MTLLIIGCLLFTTIHLIPSIAPNFKAKLVNQLGEKPYAAVFALAVLAGLVMIVLGWRGTTPEPVFTPPAWGRHLTMLLMLIAIILFAAANMPTRIKQYIRHPMLLGVVIWTVAHLLANGDSRSAVLFSLLGIWALISRPLINRREGVWQKPPVATLKQDIIVLIAGLVVYLALVFTHRHFTGMAIIPH